MNIVFLTPRLTLGGYEKVVVNYANTFSKLGHKVSILCGFKEGDLLEQIDKDIEIINFNARFRQFIFPLIKYLKKNEVDILYVPYRSYTSMSVIARWLAKNKKCVIYGTIHGYEYGRKWIEFTQGKIIKHTQVLSTLTDDLSEFESKALGIPMERYIHLKNPVINSKENIVKIAHKWLSQDKSIPVIILSGRLEKDKNIDLALKILREVLKVKEVKMLILGNGSEINKLKNLATELGVQDSVDFVGFVSNPMGYMIQSDVFLHTATIEAFGNVIVEALYCNLPIVTTDCKGPVEIIENGKYGIVIGKSNEFNIEERGAKAILDIMQGKLEFDGMREKALQYDMLKLEEQFLEPYYEYIKKNQEKNSISNCK